jgi:hypothetical protein
LQVLRTGEKVDALTDLEVVERWRKVYVDPDIIRRFMQGDNLTKEQLTC